MIFAEYFIAAFLVVSLSLFLSRYVDELDKKTNMSGAFIGGILLAAVTSLPEFITSLSSVFILHDPSLVQGNVLGSNIFNLIIIALAVILFPKRFKVSRISKIHIWTGICAILMYIIVYFGFNWDYILKIGIFQVNISSILILILYFINLKSLNSDDSNSSDNSSSSLTVKQITFRFIICSILLVIVSIFLTNVTSKLNDKLSLDSTTGGAIFLGIATSLPELTSSIALAKLGNFNAAFGNVLGSNVFNFTILSISDIFYNKGNIYITNNEAINLILYGIIASIFAILLVFTKRSSSLSKLLSALILLTYVLSIVFSI